MENVETVTIVGITGLFILASFTVIVALMLMFAMVSMTRRMEAAVAAAVAPACHPYPTTSEARATDETDDIINDTDASSTASADDGAFSESNASADLLDEDTDEDEPREDRDLDTDPDTDTDGTPASETSQASGVFVAPVEVALQQKMRETSEQRLRIARQSAQNAKEELLQRLQDETFYATFQKHVNTAAEIGERMIIYKLVPPLSGGIPRYDPLMVGEYTFNTSSGVGASQRLEVTWD